MPLVDSAVYVDGRRIADPTGLSDTFEHTRAHHGMAWIGLVHPTAEEVEAVAAEFSLHPLAVEDALSGHQRAKLERYGDVLFAVLRPARHDEASRTVEFGEVHVFVGPDFVVTVRHADSPDLAQVRARLESQPDLLRMGPGAVLYAILDQVVDEYSPVVSGLEADIDEIEEGLFSGADGGLSQRIYTVAREVIGLHKATLPLVDMLDRLREGAEHREVELELRRLYRDVHDHVLRLNERIVTFRSILDNALTAHATLVAQRQTDTSLEQNEQVKKISGWAAILFGPTLVGTIYGMNFRVMPELHWTFGYPMALGLMVLSSAVLYAVFRRKKWL